MDSIKYEPYELEHAERVRRIAPECMVLLKSDGTFPLEKPGKLALYGNGARHTLKGGTGSGDVSCHHVVSIEEGLKNAGFHITTTDWLDNYDRIIAVEEERFAKRLHEQARADHLPMAISAMGAIMPEPEYILPTDGGGDTAVYVLSRISGEGSDRRAEKGNLFLTETEIRDIHRIAKKYSAFMLVLNVCGLVDISPVADMPNILLLSQTGAVTGDAFADVLLGKSYPSGKLSDTWVRWTDHPEIGDFGIWNDTHYREGIYVGYRYYDTTGTNVLWPFGYGLSYTTFSYNMDGVTVQLGAAPESQESAVSTLQNQESAVSSQNNTEYVHSSAKEGPRDNVRADSVYVQVPVTNTGSRPGKEIVELYVSVPSGKLDQPYQVLAAFAKTSELAPGAEEILTLHFQIADLASYDSTTASSILEKGDYIIRVGSSSRSTKPVCILRLTEDVTVRKLSHRGGKASFRDWKPKKNIHADEDLSAVPVLTVTGEAFKDLPIPKPAQPDPVFAKKIDRLSDPAIASLVIGSHHALNPVANVIGNQSRLTPGAAGETTSELPGLPQLVMADGPAGLRLARDYTIGPDGLPRTSAFKPSDFLEFLPKKVQPAAMRLSEQLKNQLPAEEVHHQYTTAIPTGTALAQSWSTSVWKECGDIIGSEMEKFRVDLWLAPGINIHRNPLCGRNYEYFSEDPLLSGLAAAAITEGVQQHPGKGVTIKHFVANNQETNRYNNNSCVSERALRDIYLKPFEICIREAEPVAVMTSYNLLNGVHTSERADLLKTILRGEWGYTGLIMSDWVIPYIRLTHHKGIYDAPDAGRAVIAGNNLFMPGTIYDQKRVEATLKNAGSTSRKSRAIRESAAWVLQTIARLKS